MKLPPTRRPLYVPVKTDKVQYSSWEDCLFILKVVFAPVIFIFTCLNKLFLNLDSVFGGADYTNYPEYKTVATPVSQLQKDCKDHNWIWQHSLKRAWHIGVNGKPTGTHYRLTECIASKKHSPNHNETDLAQLESWRTSGYDIVFCSLNTYTCQKCKLSKTKEFYTNPWYSNLYDYRPIVTIPKKNETQPIATYRREIAVEPVKIYVN